ncbi:MAG: hypothetical protein KQH57_10985 [Actinomycetales bacterium]|nr:hypothetical protein [Actinomycetales bacterium]
MGGRVARGVVVGALVVGIVSVAGIARAQFWDSAALPLSAAGDDVVAPAGCSGTAEDAASAAEMARRCGADVEVTSERTEWATVFAQPDGNTRLEASAEAVRSKATGKWTDVDTALVPTDAGIAVAAPAVPMVFSDGTPGQPLARVTYDGHELSLDAPFDLGEPVVSGSTLAYLNVRDGVDLFVTVNGDGSAFSEVLRIDSAEAAADPAIAELAFPVHASDELVVEARDGGFVARERGGDDVFVSPRPVVWDSGADAASLAVFDERGARAPLPDGAGPGVVVAQNRAARVLAPLPGDDLAPMGLRVQGSDVVVTPDSAMLSDPATRWPVYIDPGVTASLADWTTVANTGWIHYRYTGDDGLGYCNQTSMGCTSIFKTRMMWEYGGLATIGALTRADVVSATFSAYGTHSYSCTAYPVSAWRVGGFTANTGWSGSVWYGSALDTISVAHKAACSNQRWIEWDVTEALRQIADENRNAVAIGLRDPYETTMAGWKRYRNDARLSVEYNRAPSAPTNAKATVDTQEYACATGASNTYLRSATPKLQATLGDPDGGDLRGVFSVWSGSNRLWLATSDIQNGDPPVAHFKDVPAGFLADGSAYRWEVYALDGGGKGSTTVKCDFTVDTSAPEAPTVAPVDTGGAVYAENGGAYGGVGQTGTFTFTSTASDVASYKYGFDGPAITPRSGASPTVTWTPTAAGPHTLSVRAVDRAGNISPVREYAFEVDFAGMNGAWALDDGSGTQAVDVAPNPPQHPLTLSTGVTWAPGPLDVRAGLPADTALAFGTNSDASRSATTAGPVLSTNESFTVMATVRLGQTSAFATAVSQDDAVTSGFELGYREGSVCPGGATGCWAFTRPTTDTTSPELVTVTSTLPAQVGEWVHLTGVYDAANQSMRLYACRVADTTELVNESPVASTPSVFAPTGVPNAHGSLVVGRGKADGQAGHGWSGEVGDVHVYDGVVDQATVRAACQSPR